jgi:glycosyltransferase involved in cell wall biosynthesis
MIKFSVIIPTYNRANLLDRCLQSLVNQIYKDFEVIVCDDGSTDNSKEIYEKYKNILKIQYLWNENWGGPARPRNKGIAASQGEWICFLDSDDWWKPNKLEICLKYTVQYDFLYHDNEIYYLKNPSKKKNLHGRSVNPKNPYLDMLLNGNPCINSSAVVKRSVIDAVGLIDEDKRLIAVEDFDYWLRIARFTKRIKYIHKLLGYYWIGETNISYNEKQIERIDALYEKHFAHIEDKKYIKQIIPEIAYQQGRIYQILGIQDKSFEKFMIALKTYKLWTFIKTLICIILLKYNMIKKSDVKIKSII